MQPVPLHRIAFVGTYPPRQCGIAIVAVAAFVIARELLAG